MRICTVYKTALLIFPSCTPDLSMSQVWLHALLVLSAWQRQLRSDVAQTYGCAPSGVAAAQQTA